MRTSIILLLLVYASLLHAQYPEVTISGSQVRTLTSNIVSGQEYKLDILLPAGYENSSKKYPVIYIMDSQWDFPLVSSIYGQQYYDGFIPEAILVGVTWGGDNPNHGMLRARDYVPANTDSGADLFLDFMKTELFPFIETHYKVDNTHRTLMGCSLGGLFTLYTLFTHTDMFTGYIAASPALNGNILSAHEKTFFEKQSNKPLKVYMTVGDVETSKYDFEKFANTMKSRSYENVKLHSKILENTGHSGTKSETYTRGLQYVFERNQLKLSDAILNKYVGTYQLGEDTAEIKNENNQLVVHGQGSSFPLLANSETHFYVTFQFLNIYFNESNNNVDSFNLVTYGGTQTLKKIK
jgi:predicted alpha/beta superfamily hydrolase